MAGDLLWPDYQVLRSVRFKNQEQLFFIRSWIYDILLRPAVLDQCFFRIPQGQQQKVSEFAPAFLQDEQTLVPFRSLAAGDDELIQILLVFLGVRSFCRGAPDPCDHLVSFFKGIDPFEFDLDKILKNPLFGAGGMCFRCVTSPVNLRTRLDITSIKR